MDNKMNLSQAAQTGTTSDVITQIELFASIIKFISPLLIGLLIIAIVIRIKKLKNKQHKQDKNVNKQYKAKNTKSKPFKSEEEMIRQLDNIKEPFDKSKYNKLNLEFSKNGKIIGGGNNGKENNIIK